MSEHGDVLYERVGTRKSKQTIVAADQQEHR